MEAKWEHLGDSLCGRKAIVKLLTLAEYRKLDPKAQGYAVYMQAEWPKSELKSHQRNPYQIGSRESDLWLQGQNIAVLEAQDSEE